jgi:predicted permease
MQAALQDLRYFLRQAVHSPGFTLTAVISLALGIAATTVVFSVVYAALIDPYPYPAAERIVRLTVATPLRPVNGVTLNGSQIQQLRQLSVVESVLAMGYQPLVLSGHAVPENVDAIELISNGFEDLGVPPIVGRGLLASDAVDGQDPQPVVVLAYKFWRERFLSNPAVVGKTLELDGKSYLIVGVAAPRFTWYSADVYLPLKLTEDPGLLYVVDFRLKPGVTHAAANAALQPLLEQFARAMPNHFPEHFRVEVEGLNEWVVRGIGGTLYLLFGAVALLLAIGCGNVSILLLARGSARQHDLAVRAAVGANRRRIVSHLLTESLGLAAIGGALGIFASYGMLTAIQALLPRYAFAPEVAIRINVPVLIFSIGVALGTGALFGLWPALRLSRTDVGQIVQSSSRWASGSVRARRTHNVLIAGQIALTLLLLAAAGSAMESFLRMLHKPLGYDPHHVMSVGIPLHEGSYMTWAARAAYFEQLRAKVAETPGVTMAAISTNATPPSSGLDTPFEILGKPAAEAQIASLDLVGPGYFALLRIPLEEGRVWSEAENRDGAHVCIVNRTLARHYFPNADAMGHSLRVPGLENRPLGSLSALLPAPNIASSWLEIAAVVEDTRNDGLRRPIKPAIFVPYTLSMRQGTQILVRSNAPPLTLLHAVQEQLATVNPEQQTESTVEDLDSWISDEPEWQQEHLAAWIFGVLAWLALALAAVGLYSVVSYAVVQRTNEFGIRMALGAQPSHVMRIVFRSTLGSVTGGIVAGLALTLVLNTILATWAGESSRDPIILLAGTLLLSFVSMIACAIPARHAATVDPMKALRFE